MANMRLRQDEDDNFLKEKIERLAGEALEKAYIRNSILLDILLLRHLRERLGLNALSTTVTTDSTEYFETFLPLYKSIIEES